MKKTIQTIFFATVLGGLAQLPAAEVWEGTDDFSSAPLSDTLWKPMGKSKRSFQYVYDGQMRCTFVNEQSDQWWAWGKN
ncbi:hypothetical protein EBZ02_08675, partial [bacterium]|nr:hypothetical protein [bacterium]